MSLQQWASNDWVRPHSTSPQEIGNLLAIVDRDLIDADGAISPDWRFGIAYNAALKLCTILLYASGYRAERAMHHYRTIAALALVLGPDWQDDARYLDTCRIKRNTVEYDLAGAATLQDASELTEFAGKLRTQVLTWLKKEHPDLLP
jgi:hypothetical protein